MKITLNFSLVLLVSSGLALAHQSRAEGPKLSIVQTTSESFLLSWPTTEPRYVLETAEKVGPLAAWRAVGAQPALVNAELRLALSVNESAQFYRLTFVPSNLPTGDFEIGGYTLISSTNISGTVEDTYKANVSNWGPEDAAVTASPSSTISGVTVVDGVLVFGEVPAGDTKESADTFTVQYDSGNPFDPAVLIWTTQATPLPPTTFGLINKALQDGLINAETALLYKVYDEFTDNRLPPQYRGRDDVFFEATAIREAARRFPTLSPATQQLLAPLLQMPDLPELDPASPLSTTSAAAPSGKKAAAGSARSHIWAVPNTVAVAWDNDVLGASTEEWAIRTAAEINTTIWPKLTGLFGKPAPGKLIGIFLVTSGLKRSYMESADCTKAKIRLAREDVDTLVHELTHALLDLNYPGQCNSSDTLWLHEATATWAMHFMDPRKNREHETARSFLGRPEIELEKYEQTPDDKPGPEHQYGAYLWFLYITRGSDTGAHYVKATWDATRTQDSLSAINAVIPGGLKERFPEFALYNWNRMRQYTIGSTSEGKPYRFYATWDKLQHSAKEEVKLKPRLDGKPSAEFSLQHRIPHLAARYYHYDFRTDSSIRTLTFTHPYWPGQESTAKVQAIVKIAGQEWKEAEDWTGIQEKKLCRDKPNEDFEELVIIISNSKYNDRNHVLTDINSSGGPTTKLKISALGCGPWVGSVKFTATHSLQDVGSEMNMTETATADNVVFDLVDEGSYKATAGLVSWHHTGSVNLGGGVLQCSGQASGTFLVNAGESVMNVSVFSPPFGDNTTLYYAALAEVNFFHLPFDPILYPCNIGGTFPPQAQHRFRRWLMTNAHIPGNSYDKIVTDAEGNLVMKGQSTQGGESWSWEFKQKPKP